jgi:hypothetical protein
VTRVGSTTTHGVQLSDMRRIAFVSCSKTKAERSAPAAALYTSALFRKSLLAALDVTNSVYILSAKHGALPLGALVGPYDASLKTMSRHEREVWRDDVSRQLAAGLVKRGDVVSLYCGEEYIAPLRRTFLQLGCRLDEPLAGLSMGQRLQRLRALNDEPALEMALNRFYRIMRHLWIAQGRGRRIGDCSGQLPWPERGVYFVTAEPTADRGGMPRIIRVGTHAVSLGSRTSLWNRISTHRGTRGGGGSHRSSIFRSHVGRALINRERHREWPDTWAKGQTAPKVVRDAEAELEQHVSRIIGDMRVLWINVSDTAGPGSDRAYLERNVIGLLSRAGLLSPISAPPWLGDTSDDWRIAASGLWNLDHLLLRPDNDFLRILETYVDITLSRTPTPEGSLAPPTWRSDLNTVTEPAQFNLFAAQVDGHV